MWQVRHRQYGFRFHTPLVGLILAAVLAGAMGLECDDDVVTTFRQTAADDIASGLKTILNAVIDGVAAAIEQAGDGSSGSTSGTST